MDSRKARAWAKRLLADEIGTLRKDAPDKVLLLYPSPYKAGMSSLGFQTIYREINASDGRSAERAFLPDDAKAWRRHGTPLFAFESGRAVSDFPIVALSVAFELEMAGMIHALELAGIPPLREERTNQHPLILAGGPLTFSNPLPLAPYVDAILVGEADETVHAALDVLFAEHDRPKALRLLAEQVPSAFVPELMDELPAVAKCGNARLPAWAPIRTPNTELRDMFLLETERGCSRSCQYCVMRRSTNGGMRIVPKERILELIPPEAKRVGLVGAAVSDHPKIVEIVNELADRGQGVGLSSLRPDRLNDAFVTALKRGGYRTLTTASDGASQRLRDKMQRKARERHIERSAELAREHRMRMKLYMMLGLPDEQDEDIDELVAFSTTLSQRTPLSLGIAPFVSKRNTPLDRMPFAGISVVERRLKRLREGVKGRVDIRSTSARWAWVEYMLAQGGPEMGRAVLDAVHAGGRFRDYKAAFERCPVQPTSTNDGYSAVDGRVTLRKIA